VREYSQHGPDGVYPAVVLPPGYERTSAGSIQYELVVLSYCTVMLRVWVCVGTVGMKAEG
jgi:hypothetical protein